MGKIPSEFKNSVRPRRGSAVLRQGMARGLLTIGAAPRAGYPLLKSAASAVVLSMHWYVDSKNGSDANDGRGPKTAFQTVQHVTQVAKPGDTLLILPGAYDQSLPKQVSFLRAANVTVVVAGAEAKS